MQWFPIFVHSIPLSFPRFSSFLYIKHQLGGGGGLRKILKQDSKTRCEFQYYYRMTWKRKKVCVYAYVIPLHKHFLYTIFPSGTFKSFYFFPPPPLPFYKLTFFSILNLSTRRKNIISYSEGTTTREKKKLVWRIFSGSFRIFFRFLL